MRVLLSSLSGLWGITLLIHLHTVLKPFNDEQRLQCMTSNRLAEIVCVLVRFCSQAIQDPLCFPLTMTVIGCATTTYAIMSVERIRCDKRRNLTPWMILLGNLIGTGIVVPLIWIPFYSHLPLHPVPVYPHAYRVGTAIVLAQCVPVLMILMTQSECIIRLFQYCFIVYGVCEQYMPSVYNNRRSVHTLYWVLAALNTLLHYTLLYTLSWSSVIEWVHILHSRSHPVTYMLLLDLISLYLSLVYWCALQEGWKGVKIVCVYSFFFGPGGGLAVYAMQRENKFIL